MAISWPFDSTVSTDGQGNPVYTRAYSSDVLAKILSMYFKNGIFSNDESSLQVMESTGMTIDVQPGSANINGRQFYEESTRTLTIQAANATLDRIDTVVLRLNLALEALTVDLYVVQGTPAATPTEPSLTRNASVYEVGLANLFIAKASTSIPQYRITDTRLNSERCGVVASIVGDTDTSAYYAQLAAVVVQAQAELSAALTTQQDSFDQWFATVQQTLGEDVAGNLLNLINYHAPVNYSVSVPTSGWAGTRPYTQTVTVAGLVDTDTPLADVTLSSDTETALAQLEAYGYVSKIVTGANAVMLTCLENKPETDLTITLKVVR